MKRVKPGKVENDERPCRGIDQHAVARDGSVELWARGPGGIPETMKARKAMPESSTFFGGKRHFEPAVEFERSPSLTAGHLLSHVKQETPVVFFNATHQPAKLGEKTSFLPGAAPDNIVGAFALRKVGEYGRFFSVIEKLIERDFQSAGHFLECFNGRYGVAIFDSRDIAAKQSSALFDVPLGKIFSFAQGAKPIAYNHNDIISQSYSCCKR